MPRGIPNPPPATPPPGPGPGAARPNRSAGPAEVTRAGPAGVSYEWRGEALIQAFNEALTRGFQQLASSAQNYWNNIEWTTERHPYMTGNERNLGFFVVTSDGGRVRLQVGTTAPYAVFEEFGTVRQAAHYPVRNTLDRVAYRFSDVIRAASREAGLL